MTLITLNDLNLGLCVKRAHPWVSVLHFQSKTAQNTLQNAVYGRAKTSQHLLQVYNIVHHLRLWIAAWPFHIPSTAPIKYSRALEARKFQYHAHLHQKKTETTLKMTKNTPKKLPLLQRFLATLKTLRAFHRFLTRPFKFYWLNLVFWFFGCCPQVYILPFWAHTCPW